MDSFSSGNVNNTGSVLYVDSGGFVGNNEGEIFNSYESGNISGENTVGGFAGIVSGNTYSSLIMNSYEIGNVEGGTYVGGFVGYDRGPGQIIDSFSSGTVHASSNKGGFSGSGGSMGNGNPVVTNSYWNKITSGLTSSYNGTGLTSSQFKSLNNFISWGFNSWDGNHWQDSITTDPWFMMTSGPVLIPDMPLEIIDGKSGTSQYTGATFSPGFVVTSTQGISPMTTDFSTSVGPNVGAYLNTPFISTLSAPTSQTSIGSYNENSGVYSITPATLTATANAATMTYGGSVPSVSGTFTTTGPTGGLANLSATWTTPATSSSNAGSYAIDPGSYSYANGAVAGDFSITQAASNATALTINPALLTFSGSISNPTKTYDGTTTATLTTSNSSATLSGFVNGQGATYTGATGSYSTPNAGTGISVSATLGTGDFTTSGSGFSWSNYSLPTMTLSGTGTITPLSVTATANSAIMTYGSTVPSLSGTFSTTGPKGGLANMSATWTTPATSASNVGIYAVNPSYSYLNGASSQDFSITNAASNATALTITPLSVTATANSATMTYGGAVPSLSGTFTTTGPKGGLANLSATWTTPATSASNVGSYAIEPGSYSYANGAVAGDFSITPAAGNDTALTITASPQIVPEYQTVFGFDNVRTPSESPAATSSSGSSPSPVPSGSATTLSSSSGTTLMLLQPTEDGMTGDGILSDEPVTPSNQP